MPKGTVDPRAVSTKTVMIDGEEYIVNVMPAGPEVHDEMVWRFPKPNTLAFFEKGLATDTTGYFVDGLDASDFAALSRAAA